MKVTLVNPPRSLYDCSELNPPLGLLRLASVARNAGADVSIVDFNLLYHLKQDLRGNAFYDAAVTLLLAEESDLYGFTSMAVDTHVALQLASLVKQNQPKALTVMGGTHFSAIAEAVLETYPWVDFIVKGEGESAFGELIENQLHQRNRAPTILRSEVKLRKLPKPAYDLVDLDSYFAVNPRRSFDFEGGRGCRFKCAFCYSPGHYGGARSFEIETRIEELAQLQALGARHVFFVEDNFLNDPADALLFCRELENARLSLTWHCYATLPQLSSAVINGMARSGCSAIFTGVDAIGESSQRAFHKSFLRDENSLGGKVVECVEAGITPTCAFLLSPPSHTCGADLDRTLRVALMARNCGAQVRLNTLTLYNGTRSEADATSFCEADNLKSQLMLDVPDKVNNNEYAGTHPKLFPFHSRYVSGREWESFVSLVHCLFTLFFYYPVTLDTLWAEERVTPKTIAEDVMLEVGDLLQIQKPLRRDAELAAAIPILEALTINTSAQRLLEAESGALLTN